MRILVVGSGGREHALSWKIAQSLKTSKLFAAPGNGGIAQVAELVDIAADDIDSLLAFSKKERIDLTVVGPETPLVKGIVDTFQKEGLKIFGPSKEHAVLEGSKIYSKELMRRLGVPTADFRIFDKYDAALEHAKTRKLPFVVKADGLAAGKGVVVCKQIDEAEAALKNMMVDRIFGVSGNSVVIEDCLVGEEASIIVVSDGKNVVELASSQDHKRVFDDDRGPNTGGMGAYSPAPVVTQDLFKKVLDTVIYPVINHFLREGRPYRGALYAGIMITDKGPFVLEFNARFGDPETQAILPRMKSDFVELLEKSLDAGLENYRVEWDIRPCVSVVLASGGYPGEYEKGMEIRGLDMVKGMNDVAVFHAGTKLGRRASDASSLVVTSGGRVLNVSALGNDMKSALDACYKAIAKIHFDKMYYRKDIGYRAVKR